MLFTIDLSSDEPVYAQLADRLRSGVVRGDLAPGERLPSARDLAASLDINLHTVLRAYQQLRDEGLIHLRRGRGATVVDLPPADLDDLHLTVRLLADQARHAGLAPQTVLTLVKEALR